MKENYKIALREYITNYSTPEEIAKKYKLDIDKFRKIIYDYIEMEKIKSKGTLFEDEIGNPFIDL